MTSHQNRRLKYFARALFRVLAGKGRTEYPRELTSNPRRILLLNGAHIGDIVMSTSLLPVLRSAFPSAEIGYVVGSWSKMVVSDHPGVKFVHTVDHWKMNRGGEPFHKKLLRYWKSRAAALKEIRECGYDVAICLHAYYSDFLSLAWQARIPVRVAYDHGVVAPLANVTAKYPDSPFVQQGQCLTELLRALHISASHFVHRRGCLAPDTGASVDELCRVLNAQTLEGLRYTVVHVGSGAPARELPVETWRSVVSELSKEHLLLFTGKGSRDEKTILEVTHGFGNCINGLNRLSWMGFVTAVRHAERLYGVESMAGHVAAAVGTRAILVYSGTAGVARWRPESEVATIWTNNLPCSPCGNMEGCEHMACVKGVTAGQIVDSTTLIARN